MASNSLVAADFQGMPAPTKEEVARMRDIASTTIINRSGNSLDTGRIRTRLTRVGGWMGTGFILMVVGTIAAGVEGVSILNGPWNILFGVLWAGHFIIRKETRSLATRRWDTRITIALHKLTQQGAQLSPDLIRLRSTLACGPIAVHIWETLPPADTLSMIRLGTQLTNACSVYPPPSIELGGDISEATSRVIELIEEVRPALYTPVLRLR